jgi:two-component system, sporulation sensor kinase E
MEIIMRFGTPFSGVKSHFIEILSVVLLITLTSGILQLIFLKNKVTKDMNSQADSIAKSVKESITETKLASDYMEHQIDLRMIAHMQYVGNLLLNKNVNEITNEDLESIRKKVGLSGITIHVKRGDDIVGVKSTDPKEIGFGFKQFQNGGLEMLESLLSGNAIHKLPVSYFDNQSFVTPITQSGSHLNTPILFKYAYYHPSNAPYLISSYLDANEVYQYTKRLGPDHEIQKLKQENAYIDEIGVLNPRVFQNSSLEKQIYPPLKKIVYGSFNEIDKNDTNWLNHYKGNAQLYQFFNTKNGKQLYKIFLPMDNDQVLFIALNYAKMKDPINQQLIILILLACLSCIVFILLADKSLRKSKETKAELWKSNQILLSIIENSPLGIIVFNKDNRVMVWNKSAEHIFGWSEDEVLGQFNPSIPRDEKESYIERIRSLQGGESYSLEQECRNKKGATIRISCSIAPLFDPKNNCIGYVSIQQDITNRKKMEEKLLQSEKLAIVSELSASVAHEIRNPLASIKGFVQLLQESSHEHQFYLDIMRAELDRINDIVTEFMNLAKPQAHQFSKNNVRMILQHTLPLFDSLANLNNIQISTHFGNQPLIVNCIEHQLKQVFINIMKNSVEAMQIKGQLQISADLVENNNISIRFKDNGPGIPEERLAKLGEPFYTTKEKGSGLGLMICYKIIETHNGQIHITSKESVGTTVEILLPVA